MYPSKQLATQEFETKWVPEFMPRGKMENHPKYGWKAKYKNGELDRIVWNNGLPTYFKTYSQDVHKIQAATLWACFVDEEMPEDMYDEVRLRLLANDGYYNMVFTATKGQALWYRAMERVGKKDEMFKDALKLNATMFDCLEYEDGDKNTPWTKEKIQGAINNCSTENEVKKRIYGRFVMDEGLKYPSFSMSVNVVKPYPIPSDWHIYSGVDIGSGGKTGHPGAIIFIAVRPDYQKGAVFKGWRGNKVDVTTSEDILNKYRRLRGGMRPVGQYYDWASKDFFTYASRLGETFISAEKGHELGEDIINTIFKGRMLDIFECEELEELPVELISLTKLTKKENARDDYIDAMRYAITKIPWNYEALTSMYFEKEDEEVREPFCEITERRKMFEDEVEDEMVNELEMWNELYD